MAGLYAINRDTIKSCGPVPPEIALYITQAEYTTVCSEVQQSDNEAMLMSCGIEVGVCFISGLFCIFCAHPCIVEMISNANLPRRLQTMNSTLYGGLPILSMAGTSINFNTGLLAENGRTPASIGMVAPIGVQVYNHDGKNAGTMAMHPAPNGYYQTSQGQYAAVQVVEAMPMETRV